MEGNEIFIHGRAYDKIDNINEIALFRYSNFKNLALNSKTKNSQNIEFAIQ